MAEAENTEEGAKKRGKKLSYDAHVDAVAMLCMMCVDGRLPHGSFVAVACKSCCLEGAVQRI